MRTLTLAFLLALVSLPFTIAAQDSLYDAQHYVFHVELSDQSDTIKGKAIITVKLLKPASTLLLDFSTATGGKGMTVVSCLMNEAPADFQLKENNEKLDIVFKKAQAAGSTHIFTIEYKGVPSDGLIISKNMYGHRSFFADNWPNRGHKWLPCLDHPGDKATVEFFVTAPAHYRVVSNGLLQEEKLRSDNTKQTHWKEDVPIATKVMVIGVAEFAVDLAGKVQGDVPVYSWVYPEDKEKGFYDYGQAKDVLPFFINYVGPYGYKKLANVQSKTIFGGLENANTIFYAENTITGTRKSESLLAHEIAHQWFGNMATEKTFAHLWLSEGFATYMTVLYMENKYGKDTAISMLKNDRKEVIRSPVTAKRSVVDDTKDYMALLNTNSYQKGGWILHMLRKELGDSVFHNSIREYYRQYANSNADTRDLQRVFEKVSGKNLSVFFDQWLYRPGIPQLEITWRYAFKTGKYYMTVKQMQEKGFVFPLTVKFTDPSGKIILKKFDIVNRNTELEFVLPKNTDTAELDPETSLLFKGTIKYEPSL
ncbi:MAG: peptidase M1 [Citrobacter freundii]|nr:MAG: peptidase M1 [Citrobacter freundii]